MMALVWNVLKTATSRLLPGKAIVSSPATFLRSNPLLQVAARFSSYDPYPKFEKPPDVYKKQMTTRYEYRYKLFTGGLLPRPEGPFEDMPLPMPRVDPRKRDQWTSKKALYGQNDYIDILGDGIVHPVQLIQGPQWMRGFKGNEFQRLIRRLKFQGPMLKNMFPTRYHNIKKRLFFLYKRLNRRKRAPFWGGRGSGKLHRRTNLDRIF